MMKKPFTLGLALTLSLTGTALRAAQEIPLNQASDWKHEVKLPLNCNNGVFQLKGIVHLFSTRTIAVEPGKKYSFTAELRTSEKERLPGVCVAVVFVDDKGRKISAREYMPIPGTDTELAAPAALTDNTIRVKRNPLWKLHNNMQYVVAFDAKADRSDLPNQKVSTPVTMFASDGDTVKATLEKPLYAAFPAGTKVRLHRSASFYQPCPDGVFYNFPKTEWEKVGGSFVVPAKAKKFFPAVIYYARGKYADRVFEMRNFKITIE